MARCILCVIVMLYFFSRMCYYYLKFHHHRSHRDRRSYHGHYHHILQGTYREATLKHSKAVNGTGTTAIPSGGSKGDRPHEAGPEGVRSRWSGCGKT